MKINWTIIVALMGLVLIGATGFAAWTAGVNYGTQNAQSVQREFFANRFGQQGQGAQTAQTDQSGQAGQGARGQFGRVAAAGTVKSVQGNKIEVTTQNGNVVTVTVDQQTQILKTVSGQVSDLQPGMRVAVTSDQTGNNVTGRLITIQAQGAPTP